MPIKVDWAVMVDGINCTSSFNPFVIEIEVVDQAGTTSDAATLKLADDGRIRFPQKGADISIVIQGVTVFTGVTKTPRWTTSKNGGGLMTINASGHDTEGPAKEGRHFAVEDATLDDYAQEFAKRAGFSIKVDPELAKIKRAWWGPDGRSFLHEMQRLAREHDSTFKVSGKKTILAKRGSGMTPSGQSLPTIQVRRPGNLISADMEPYEASAVYRDARTTYFDRKQAKFVEEKVDIRSSLGGAGKAASQVLRGLRADKQDARDRGEGRKGESEREQGGGTVEIDLEPQARAEATCTLSGLRPGIDGTYRIESVTHTLRAGDGGGATTKLALKQPAEGTAKDERKAGEGE